VGRAPFRIEASLPAQGRFQGFSPDNVIYLIMVDRFANGDPSNDDPSKSRGVTAIWITPASSDAGACCGNFNRRKVEANASASMSMLREKTYEGSTFIWIRRRRSVPV
jgi:hypothetical protein